MPTEPHVDCYAALGIPPSAKDEIVRAAYKVMVDRYQRGRLVGTPDELQQRMADAARAYEVLVDPVRRRRYDLHRRIDESTSRLPSPRAPLAPRGEIAANDAGWRRPGVIRLVSLLALVLVAAVAYLFVVSLDERSSANRSDDVDSAPRTASVAAPRDAEGAVAPPLAATPPPVATVVTAAPTAVPATEVAKAAPAAMTTAADSSPAKRVAPPRRHPPSPRGAIASRSPASAPACTEVVVALGLCNPAPTRQDP